MFGLFTKDPVKKLKEKYQDVLAKAMHAQRNGDIETYSRLTAESEKILEQIESAENN